MSIFEAVKIAAALPVYIATTRRITNAHMKMMILAGKEEAGIGSAAETTWAPAAREKLDFDS